ncbi:hypothetical protein GWK08_08910 [Leptobacterium flavescens]|uniref:Uncharacterized protein n=1 Tax=Leptobacterium flavescens TaxID=472055 RepID=A0A6P0UK05_9FLAO|nr:hypothetical protein [Leptobacterium flavescens]NER13554.1 hypothetical protein [Leptobacterium flavescens]
MRYARAAKGIGKGLAGIPWFIWIAFFVWWQFFRKKRPDLPQTRPVDYSKTTITNSTAKKYANDLFESMRHNGTKESAIEDIFDHINGHDYILIYNQFGVKPYNGFGSPDGVPILKETDPVYHYNLTQWLDAELNEHGVWPFSDRALRKKVANVLSEVDIEFSASFFPS